VQCFGRAGRAGRRAGWRVVSEVTTNIGIGNPLRAIPQLLAAPARPAPTAAAHCRTTYPPRRTPTPPLAHPTNTRQPRRMRRLLLLLRTHSSRFGAASTKKPSLLQCRRFMNGCCLASSATSKAVRSFWVIGVITNASWFLMLAVATKISAGGVALVVSTHNFVIYLHAGWAVVLTF